MVYKETSNLERGPSVHLLPSCLYVLIHIVRIGRKKCDTLTTDMEQIRLIVNFGTRQYCGLIILLHLDLLYLIFHQTPKACMMYEARNSRKEQYLQ